jgi:hypothetical protein
MAPPGSSQWAFGGLFFYFLSIYSVFYKIWYSLVERCLQRAHFYERFVMTDTISFKELWFLARKLGPTLTVTISGSRRLKGVTEGWLDGDPDHMPSPEQSQRLKVAYEAFLLIAGTQGEEQARNWFTGSLDGDDVNPCEALRDGRLEDVAAAAKRFAER